MHHYKFYSFLFFLSHLPSSFLFPLISYFPFTLSCFFFLSSSSYSLLPFFSFSPIFSHHLPSKFFLSFNPHMHSSFFFLYCPPLISSFLFPSLQISFSPFLFSCFLLSLSLPPAFFLSTPSRFLFFSFSPLCFFPHLLLLAFISIFSFISTKFSWIWYTTKSEGIRLVRLSCINIPCMQ